MAFNLDILIKRWKTKSWRIPETAIISGLFIGTILGEGELWYIVVIASAIAMLSKHIIRFKGKNIFNPASFGLVAVSIIFSVSHGWWASSNIYATILFGLFIAYWFQRFHLVLGFWVPFALLSVFLTLFVTKQPLDVVGPFLNNTALFFSFLMLTEPKTSPIQPKGRVMFGVLVAIFYLIFRFFTPGNSILLGLLLANLFVPFINKIEMKRQGM